LKCTSSQEDFSVPVLTIGEVAKRSGLRTSAIRYYEKIGLLPKPARINGRRLYDQTVLERLAIIRFARRVGFGITDTVKLLDGTLGRPPPERWRMLAHEKMMQIDRLITEASVMRKLLLDTLDQRCPKLVERGDALTTDPFHRSRKSPAPHSRRNRNASPDERKR
jgi:MerR family transcriptional regulator, redox-sensitive transcriptional activator SoxR